jgi:hypothetical protein
MGFMLFSGNKKEPFGFKGFSALWAQKVLKIDRPWAGGFLGLTALQAEGCGGGCRRGFIGRLSEGSFEVCVIFESYYFDDWPPAAATPYPASRDFS